MIGDNNMKKIKELIELLWFCKEQVLYMWLFLSLLSLCDKTEYDIPTTLLIDAVISITFVLVVIIAFKIKHKYFK